MATLDRLEVLNPTVDSITTPAVMAARPNTLDRTVIGLLANGKRNSEEILEIVYEILSDRFEFGGSISITKSSASRPCDSDVLSDLGNQCDVVVTASGD